MQLICEYLSFFLSVFIGISQWKKVNQNQKKKAINVAIIITETIKMIENQTSGLNENETINLCL